MRWQMGVVNGWGVWTLAAHQPENMLCVGHEYCDCNRGQCVNFIAMRCNRALRHHPLEVGLGSTTCALWQVCGCWHTASGIARLLACVCACCGRVDGTSFPLRRSFCLLRLCCCTMRRMSLEPQRRCAAAELHVRLQDGGGRCFQHLVELGCPDCTCQPRQTLCIWQSTAAVPVSVCQLHNNALHPCIAPPSTGSWPVWQH